MDKLTAVENRASLRSMDGASDENILVILGWNPRTEAQKYIALSKPTRPTR